MERLDLDYWWPEGTRISYTPPKPGDLIAWDHAVWRVIEVNPVPPTEWTDRDRKAVEEAGQRPAATWEGWRERAEPAVAVIRPVAVTSDDVRARDHDKHLRHSRGARWHIYTDEHYPLCGACGEPAPCRDKLGQRIADRALQRMSHFETAGMCPCCREPITSRQRSITFPDNLEIPAGPPVTYHTGRRGCRYSAADYERRWVAADLNRRRATLSCPGHVTNHNDGTYDCTELNECPGPLAFHTSYSTCRCPDCHASGTFGCHPKPDARRNTGAV